MKAERPLEEPPIEELLTVRDTEAKRRDGRTDMILEPFAAKRELTIPDA